MSPSGRSRPRIPGRAKLLARRERQRANVGDAQQVLDRSEVVLHHQLVMVEMTVRVGDEEVDVQRRVRRELVRSAWCHTRAAQHHGRDAARLSGVDMPGARSRRTHDTIVDAQGQQVVRRVVAVARHHLTGGWIEIAVGERPIADDEEVVGAIGEVTRGLQHASRFTLYNHVRPVIAKPQLAGGFTSRSVGGFLHVARTKVSNANPG